MRTAIRSGDGREIDRLESLRANLDELIERAAELSSDPTESGTAPLFHLFAYGFGFGNEFSRLFRRSGPEVRDLLAIADRPSTVPISTLAEDWDSYRAHIEGLAPDMLGQTPMVEAFVAAYRRFEAERRRRRFGQPPILVVVSDGVPSQGSPDQCGGHRQ